MSDETIDEVGENNDKQVLLSEEVEFLEELAAEVLALAEEYADDPRLDGLLVRVQDRTDEVRAGMSTAEKPDPDAQADVGIEPEEETP